MTIDVQALLPQGPAALAARRAALTDTAATMIRSRILAIAAEVRELQASGRQVCNLTIGDFSPDWFRIPPALETRIARALAEGETNYPPADGLPELRAAIAEATARWTGLDYGPEAVVVGAGARPPIYAAFRCLADAGDAVVYGVPSWNVEYYLHLAGLQGIAVPTGAEEGFHLTAEQIAPHLDRARIVHVNSPLNPTGTCISAEALAGIAEAIVRENERRGATGRKSVMLLYDMVYGLLTYGEARHHHPVALVPESAPYVVSIDAVSKSFAGTGLRVGWALLPHHLRDAFRAYIGHTGAWAPRFVQKAVAGFLVDAPAVEDWLDGFRSQLRDRLDRIHRAFQAMQAEGLPVEAIEPQGAIYLSVRVGLRGRRTAEGRQLASDEEVRRYLLQEAGVAVVPFRAFGQLEEAGWFRTSVGAVGPEELDGAMERLAAAIRATRPG